MTQGDWDTARAEVVETCRRAATERLVVGTAGNVSLGRDGHVLIGDRPGSGIEWCD